jgi:3'-phosphoadenosine 5'-phosphosulfate sulfotransferase (PAPS reductase)/FAD synthetase
MYYIVSFSGGKDSTAVLLRLLEEKKQVDEILFFDTGWEWSEVYTHVKKVEEYIPSPQTAP